MVSYDEKPILIFWESTKACKLKCRHCRAEAILNPLPGELETEEAFRMMDMIRGFGTPYPVLIISGGDPLMRKDMFEIISYARDIDVPIGIAPTVTDLLGDKIIENLKNLQVKFVSISLDGGHSNIHDSIRGVNGHFNQTIRVIKKFIRNNFKLQVNTLAAKENVHDLPYIAKILMELDVKIWEVFFLIKVGRGIDMEDLAPSEYEDVINFLYEVSRYGLEIRTVEAPFYRRVVSWRAYDNEDKEHLDIQLIKRKYNLGELYVRLTSELVELIGKPKHPPKTRLAYTRDGNGIIFIAYNGDIYPSGFAPYRLGNIRKDDIVDIYRNNSILKRIRKAEFKGRCGVCEYREMCGGSRARAYVTYGDILEEDPACVYKPVSVK